MDVDKARELYTKYGSYTAVGQMLGVHRSTVQRALLGRQPKEYNEESLVEKPPVIFETDDKNSFLFGVASDQHLCSKYSRLDILNDLYDKFEEEGCRIVLNAGNWIDGEAKFNVHDLLVHGMDSQLRYLVRNYPKRNGIVTYAVTGMDHEGWIAQREGVDIGKYAEQAFRDLGREDWVDLGVMEASVILKNKFSRVEAIINVLHPGMGSTQAHSYVGQKIIEEYDEAEKPDMVVFGHYHKLWFGNHRNVWAISGGTTQGKTIFMKKKRIDPHMGGVIVKVTQDPKTGRLVRCRAEILRYFNSGISSGRWSVSGDVNNPNVGLNAR